MPGLPEQGREAACGQPAGMLGKAADRALRTGLPSCLPATCTGAVLPIPRRVPGGRPGLCHHQTPRATVTEDASYRVTSDGHRSAEGIHPTGGQYMTREARLPWEGTNTKDRPCPEVQKLPKDSKSGKRMN